MIFDKLENLNKYKHLHKRFEEAFNFIQKTDLESLTNGKHSIDGGDIYASVAEYLTKSEGFLEGHKEYIDIQLITKGSEKIGYAHLNDQKLKSNYDQTNDIVFYYGESEYITLVPGHFAVFFPEDLHKPGIIKDKVEEVKKIVLKIKI